MLESEATGKGSTGNHSPPPTLTRPRAWDPARTSSWPQEPQHLVAKVKVVSSLSVCLCWSFHHFLGIFPGGLGVGSVIQQTLFLWFLPQQPIFSPETTAPSPTRAQALRGHLGCLNREVTGKVWGPVGTLLGVGFGGGPHLRPHSIHVLLLQESQPKVSPQREGHRRECLEPLGEQGGWPCPPALSVVAGEGMHAAHSGEGADPSPCNRQWLSSLLSGRTCHWNGKPKHP